MRGVRFQNGARIYVDRRESGTFCWRNGFDPLLKLDEVIDKSITSTYCSFANGTSQIYTREHLLHVRIINFTIFMFASYISIYWMIQYVHAPPPPWMFLTQKLFGPQKFITNLLIRVFIRTSDDPLDFTVVLWESPVVGDCGKTFTGFISYSTWNGYLRRRRTLNYGLWESFHLVTKWRSLNKLPWKFGVNQMLCDWIKFKDGA